MGALAIVLGVLVLMCVLVVWGGRALQRRLAQRSPESVGLRKVTLTGVLTQACLVVYLVAGVAIYHVAPESALGEFLHTWYGWPVALITGLALFTLVGTALWYLGHPLDRQEAKRDGKPS